MNVRTNILTLVLWCFAFCSNHAQDIRKQTLYEERSPLSIQLAVSLSEVRKKTNESTNIPAPLSFKNEGGGWNSKCRM